MKNCLLLPVLLLTLAGAAAAADRVEDSSSGQSPEKGDLVLFPMDDVTIPWRDNLKLTLQAPQKYAGNPVLRSDSDEGPEGCGPVLYGTVLKEKGKLRMWYVAEPRPDPRIPNDPVSAGYYRPTAYAESRDGIHWTRPDLGLVDFRGSRHNNLVSFAPANEPYARPYDFVAVLRDPEDPNPDRLYKMAYITRDFPRQEVVTVTAVSPDGYRWTLANTTMFTKGQFENSSLIKFKGLYYVAGQNVPPFDSGVEDGSYAGRVMKVFFSPDFHHWSGSRALSFYRSAYIPTWKHFGQEDHMGAGLWNRGNVILGYYGQWHGNTLRSKPHPENPYLGASAQGLTGLEIDLGMVISNDAIHYREPVRNFVAVHHGTADEWDYPAVLQSNGFANTATQTLIWYSHWNTNAPDMLPALPAPLPPELARHPYGVGLLTLPRDRFGYFSKLLAVSGARNPAIAVTKRDASCLSRSFTLAAASRLSVNVADVSPAAPLQIALVDDAEEPLPGYTAELTEASLKAPVRWAGGSETVPAATAFRVKITWPVAVGDAKLYAVYLEHP